jgi:hypothetical protein
MKPFYVHTRYDDTVMYINGLVRSWSYKDTTLLGSAI